MRNSFESTSGKARSQVGGFAGEGKLFEAEFALAESGLAVGVVVVVVVAAAVADRSIAEGAYDL